MTYLSLQPRPDLRSRKAMTEYLRGHKRYWTMSSWNLSTSYAHCIKIAQLNLTHDEREACYRALECAEAFEEFNAVLRDFADNAIGTNGRSGGYLVLYVIHDGKCYPGRNMDKDETFDGWSLDDLRARCRLVLDFDEWCEQAVAAFVNFARTHDFVDEVAYRAERVVCARERLEER